MNHTDGAAISRANLRFTEDGDYEWMPMVLALGMDPLTEA